MKNSLVQIINIVTVLTMTYFAIPKLLGKPQSVAGFEQFEKAIQLDAAFFRIFTGIAELSLVLMVLIFAFNRSKQLGTIAYAFLLTTMAVALGLEFFARPAPKILLVIIAIVMATFAILNLNIISKTPKSE